MRFMARSLIHEDSIFNIGIIREIQPHMIPWPTHCHVLSDWHQWRLNNAQYHSHPSTLSSSTLDNANVSRSSSVVKKFKTSLLVENRSHRSLNPYLIFRYLLFLARLLVLDPASMSLDSSKGDITIGGRIVLKSAPLLNVDESMDEGYSRLVIKAVGDPVWYTNIQTVLYPSQAIPCTNKLTSRRVLPCWNQELLLNIRINQPTRWSKSIWRKCNIIERPGMSLERLSMPSPVPVSHRRMVLSHEPDMIWDPSGENATESTWLECPAKLFRIASQFNGFPLFTDTICE